jgi:hypothetical protein
MMAAATAMAIAHPIKILAVNDNDDTLPAVVLKRKD